MTRTTDLFAKDKSDDKPHCQDPIYDHIYNKYIVIIIFHGMEYVTVNIEET